MDSLPGKIEALTGKLCLFEVPGFPSTRVVTPLTRVVVSGSSFLLPGLSLLPPGLSLGITMLSYTSTPDSPLMLFAQVRTTLGLPLSSLSSKAHS
jgi:hypothetical protein